ncbi:MAG: Type-1 restriction enzyme MjaXIP specificity protein [Candidatus Methanoperedenaceae archaeon GB50]|nr:MAG: Type-1 restriction enzyme MjaXIP specificity protein [Candidatus Methanoperedenaceae archaeon GB50]
MTEQIPPGYKKTEIGIIPEDWEVRRLGKDSIFFSGGTPNTSVKDYYKYEIPFITSSDLNKRKIKNTSSYISRKGLIYSSAKLIERGQLLLALYGATAGAVAISEIDGAINQAVLAISSTMFDKYFLFYWFEKNKEYIIKTYTQGGQPNLNSHIIKNLLVTLPHLPEQRAIARVLSDFDKLIESLDRLIEKKKLIKKGTMQLLLTGKKRLPGFKGEWVRKKLGEVANKITMGQSPNSTYYNDKGVGLPLIQGNADLKDSKTIKRIYTTQITKLCKEGDMILTVRAPVGKVAKTDFDACIGRGVCAISYENDFLFYYLKFIENLWTKFSSGSTFDAVDSNTIKNLLIPIPSSLKEQRAIARVLSDMDAEIEALERKKEKYEMLKKGAMQSLLTGKIRLKNANVNKEG